MLYFDGDLLLAGGGGRREAGYKQLRRSGGTRVQSHRVGPDSQSQHPHGQHRFVVKTLRKTNIGVKTLLLKYFKI